MLSYCLYGGVGNHKRAVIGGMNAVLGKFGIVMSMSAQSVEHFVVRDEFVGKRNYDPVYYGKLVVEELAHTKFIGCGK